MLDLCTCSNCFAYTYSYVVQPKQQELHPKVVQTEFYEFIQICCIRVNTANITSLCCADGE